MTDRQRRQRAAFIREQPGLWLVLLYAVSFLGCAVARDALDAFSWSSDAVFSRASGYLMPLATALPVWVALRGWTRRVEAGDAETHPA